MVYVFGCKNFYLNLKGFKRLEFNSLIFFIKVNEVYIVDKQEVYFLNMCGFLNKKNCFLIN